MDPSLLDRALVEDLEERAESRSHILKNLRREQLATARVAGVLLDGV
jgi:hypothetical protein